MDAGHQIVLVTGLTFLCLFLAFLLLVATSEKPKSRPGRYFHGFQRVRGEEPVRPKDSFGKLMWGINERAIESMKGFEKIHRLRMEGLVGRIKLQNQLAEFKAGRARLFAKRSKPRRASRTRAQL